jgi:predicted outer membrane repeat protein
MKTSSQHCYRTECSRLNAFFSRSRKLKGPLLLGLCFLWFASWVNAKTIFVNYAATGTNNGSSWKNAFVHLQDALAVALENDNIWVSRGIYYPDEGVGYTDNVREYAFELKTNVGIYGGFVGEESSVDHRNPAVNLTTLSGDIRQDNLRHHNSRNVLRGNNVTGFVLNGFTITSGCAGPFDENNQDNRKNLLDYIDGGGLRIDSSEGELKDCILLGNIGPSAGGILCFQSNISISNCKFLANTAITDNGGAIYCLNDSILSAYNCNFSGNSANTGGALAIGSTALINLINCSFSGNTAEYNGASLYSYRYGDLDKKINIINCSFYGNASLTKADLFFRDYRITVNFVNSIFSSDLVDYQVKYSGGKFTFKNCLMTGWESYGWENDPTINLGGNSGADPLFIAGKRGDLRPYSNSPAVNNGSLEDYEAFAADLTTDLAGLPRKVDQIDIGAYEYQGNFNDFKSSFVTIDDLDGDGILNYAELALGTNISKPDALPLYSNINSIGELELSFEKDWYALVRLNVLIEVVASTDLRVWKILEDDELGTAQEESVRGLIKRMNYNLGVPGPNTPKRFYRLKISLDSENRNRPL